MKYKRLNFDNKTCRLNPVSPDIHEAVYQIRESFRTPGSHNPSTPTMGDICHALIERGLELVNGGVPLVVVPLEEGWQKIMIIFESKKGGVNDQVKAISPTLNPSKNDRFKGRKCRAVSATANELMRRALLEEKKDVDYHDLFGECGWLDRAMRP